MAFNHHPGIRRTDTTCAHHANRLTLQQLPHKQSGEPAFVLPSPHEYVCLSHAASSSQRERCSQLCSGVSQDTWGVAYWDAMAGGSVDVDVVVADGIVAVCSPAGCFQGPKEVVVPSLSLWLRLCS